MSLSSTVASSLALRFIQKPSGIISQPNSADSIVLTSATVRSFYLGAYPLQTDSADRILLQKPLMDYAAIGEDAILVAMDDRIEIWSPEQYNRVAMADPNAFSDLANQVLGGGNDGAGSTDDDFFGMFK